MCVATCDFVRRAPRWLAPHPSSWWMQGRTRLLRVAISRIGSHPFLSFSTCFAWRAKARVGAAKSCAAGRRRPCDHGQWRRNSHLPRVPPVSVCVLSVEPERYRYLRIASISWPMGGMQGGIETCLVKRGRWLRWPAARRRWPRREPRVEGEGRNESGAQGSDVSVRDPRTKNDPKKEKTGRKLRKHVGSKRSWLPKLQRCNSLNRRG